MLIVSIFYTLQIPIFMILIHSPPTRHVSRSEPWQDSSSYLPPVRLTLGCRHPSSAQSPESPRCWCCPFDLNKTGKREQRDTFVINHTKAQLLYRGSGAPEVLPYNREMSRRDTPQQPRVVEIHVLHRPSSWPSCVLCELSSPHFVPVITAGHVTRRERSLSKVFELNYLWTNEPLLER